MKNKYVLDPLSAAHALTALVLKKADDAFYRMRRTKERINSPMVPFLESKAENFRRISS